MKIKFRAKLIRDVLSIPEGILITPKNVVVAVDEKNIPSYIDILENTARNLRHTAIQEGIPLGKRK